MTKNSRDDTPDPMSDTAAGDPPANEPEVDEEDEQDIPYGIQLQDIICLTPESAVGGLEVDSFAGSGPVIYPDFRTAILDAWGVFEDHYGLHGKPLMGKAVSPEAREGRQAFEALLDRFEQDGFTSDLAQELRDLCSEYTPYRIVEVSYVLPDGLDDLLDTAYGRLEEDEEDEEAKEARASAPPRDQFDLHNPAHLEWLANQLEFWNYI